MYYLRETKEYTTPNENKILATKGGDMPLLKAKMQLST